MGTLSDFIERQQMSHLWSIDGPQRTGVTALHAYHWPAGGCAVIFSEASPDDWEIYVPPCASNTIEDTHAALERIAASLRAETSKSSNP
jgi:hypothetical protein